MRILNIILFFVLSSQCFAQIQIQYLNDVPKEFMTLFLQSAFSALQPTNQNH